MSRKGKSVPAEPGGPFHNPFGALGRLKAALPEGTPPAHPAPVGGAQPKAKRAPARAVVRYERKGRGGKEATVVEQLGLPAAELASWLKELKQRLGCGGAVEGDTLVLQGDHRDRLPELLEQRGVGKISVG